MLERCTWIALVTLVFLPACYLRHSADAPTVPPRFDAGRDTGAPSSCEPNDRYINVVLAGGAGCDFGGFLGFPERSSADGDGLLIELTVAETGAGCQISLGFLSVPVRDALLRVMERVFDGYFELGPEHFLVRNTSLCDGPPAEECPIVIEAESGRARVDPELFRVGVRFGETECTGECGGIRELDFELDLGERVDTLSVPQGEIRNRGSTHFANMRSWNSCTDEPDTITWAHWLE